MPTKAELKAAQRAINRREWAARAEKMRKESEEHRQQRAAEKAARRAANRAEHWARLGCEPPADWKTELKDEDPGDLANWKEIDYNSQAGHAAESRTFVGKDHCGNEYSLECLGWTLHTPNGPVPVADIEQARQCVADMEEMRRAGSDEVGQQFRAGTHFGSAFIVKVGKNSLRLNYGSAEDGPHAFTRPIYRDGVNPPCIYMFGKKSKHRLAGVPITADLFTNEEYVPESQALKF